MSPTGKRTIGGGGGWVVVGWWLGGAGWWWVLVVGGLFLLPVIDRTLLRCLRLCSTCVQHFARESKLTRMLQDSLGGNARTLMVNVPFFCFPQSEGYLSMFDLLFSIISVTLGISEITDRVCHAVGRFF